MTTGVKMQTQLINSFPDLFFQGIRQGTTPRLTEKNRAVVASAADAAEAIMALAPLA